MWQDEQGFLELFLAYFELYKNNLAYGKKHREFLLDILLCHERVISNCGLLPELDGYRARVMEEMPVLEPQVIVVEHCEDEENIGSSMVITKMEHLQYNNSGCPSPALFSLEPPLKTPTVAEDAQNGLRAVNSSESLSFKRELLESELQGNGGASDAEMNDVGRHPAIWDRTQVELDNETRDLDISSSDYDVDFEGPNCLDQPPIFTQNNQTLTDDNRVPSPEALNQMIRNFSGFRENEDSILTSQPPAKKAALELSHPSTPSVVDLESDVQQTATNVAIVNSAGAEAETDSCASTRPQTQSGRVPQTRRSYICSQCKRLFRSQELFKRHPCVVAYEKGTGNSLTATSGSQATNVFPSRDEFVSKIQTERHHQQNRHLNQNLFSQLQFQRGPILASGGSTNTSYREVQALTASELNPPASQAYSLPTTNNIRANLPLFLQRAPSIVDSQSDVEVGRTSVSQRPAESLFAAVPSQGNNMNYQRTVNNSIHQSDVSSPQGYNLTGIQQSNRSPNHSSNQTTDDIISLPVMTIPSENSTAHYQPNNISSGRPAFANQQQIAQESSIPVLPLNQQQSPSEPPLVIYQQRIRQAPLPMYRQVQKHATPAVSVAPRNQQPILQTTSAFTLNQQTHTQSIPNPPRNQRRNSHAHQQDSQTIESNPRKQQQIPQATSAFVANQQQLNSQPIQSTPRDQQQMPQTTSAFVTNQQLNSQPIQSTPRDQQQIPQTTSAFVTNQQLNSQPIQSTPRDQQQIPQTTSAFVTNQQLNSQPIQSTPRNQQQIPQITSAFVANQQQQNSQSIQGAPRDQQQIPQATSAFVANQQLNSQSIQGATRNQQQIPQTTSAFVANQQLNPQSIQGAPRNEQQIPQATSAYVANQQLNSQSIQGAPRNQQQIPQTTSAFVTNQQLNPQPIQCAAINQLGISQTTSAYVANQQLNPQPIQSAPRDQQQSSQSASGAPQNQQISQSISKAPQHQQPISLPSNQRNQELTSKGTSVPVSNQQQILQSAPNAPLVQEHISLPNNPKNQKRTSRATSVPLPDERQISLPSPNTPRSHQTSESMIRSPRNQQPTSQAISSISQNQLVNSHPSRVGLQNPAWIQKTGSTASRKPSYTPVPPPQTTTSFAQRSHTPGEISSLSQMNQPTATSTRAQNLTRELVASKRSRQLSDSAIIPSETEHTTRSNNTRSPSVTVQHSSISTPDKHALRNCAQTPVQLREDEMNATESNTEEDRQSPPFRCRVCQRGFSRAGDRQRHERTHASNRMCAGCGKEYSRPATLRQHEAKCSLLKGKNSSTAISNVTSSPLLLGTPVMS